jgi:septal ring factor EnvC (AmiA/AmiB activator)
MPGPVRGDDRKWTLVHEDGIWRALGNAAASRAESGAAVTVAPEARAVAAEQRVNDLEREWDGWKAKYQERLREDEELKDGIAQLERIMDQRNAKLAAAEAERDALKGALQRIEERTNPGKTGNPAAHVSDVNHIARAALAASVSKEEEPSGD